MTDKSFDDMTLPEISEELNSRLNASMRSMDNVIQTMKGINKMLSLKDDKKSDINITINIQNNFIGGRL